MPRQPRLDTPGALHHVMGRGIDGIDIFSQKKDCVNVRLKNEIMDLESLVNKICDNEVVEKEELLTGSKKKRVVKCRKILCQIAVKKMGYSGADVARFLGVTTSAVNRLAVSEKLPDVEKYT